MGENVGVEQVLFGCGLTAPLFVHFERLGHSHLAQAVVEFILFFMKYGDCFLTRRELTFPSSLHLMSHEHMPASYVSRSMEAPKIAELWQALRASGLECLAPTLVQLRVRSLDDVTCRVTELSDAGVLQWQIEAT